MKIRLKVVTEVEFTFPDVPRELQKQSQALMASSIEGGWRYGMAKDMAIMEAVLSRQFQTKGSSVSVVDQFFDFQFPD